jgi:hypothetical protein
MTARVTPPMIGGGDPAGVLRKRYSGNLLTQSAWDGGSCKAPLSGMAMMAHKILTIRSIKLWKHPCRIIEA